MADGARARLKTRARAVKRDIVALCLAGRDPRVPWYAKALAMTTAAYALSPIDLIPDFIPVLGYLDDAILLPVLIVLTLRLIPRPVLDELRQQAEQRQGRRLPGSRAAAGAVIAVWAMLAISLLRALLR